MRDKKFRFWNEKEKSMTYDYTIKTIDNGVIIDIVVAEIPGYISTQYTGLKDNTKWCDLSEDEQIKWNAKSGLISIFIGKDIYDGDILDLCQEKYPNEHGKCIVTFHDGCVCVKSINGSQYIERLSDTLTLSYKIIGNIHENPELLSD